MAVERLKSCDNIVALAQELGVHRRLLYKWRDQLEPIGVRGLLMFFWPSRVARLEILRAVGKGVFLLSRTDHKNITVPDQSQPWSALTRTRALRGFSS